MATPDIAPQVTYRDIKYPRLEFRTGALALVLPKGRDADSVLVRHRKWIDNKRAFISECLKEADGKELVARTDTAFKELILHLAENAAGQLGVTINNIRFMTMRTKWASFSSKRNLTANKLMAFLPEPLIRYVVFHETAHGLEKRHNEVFWRLVEKRFENHRVLERELLTFWFLIARRQAS